MKRKDFLKMCGLFGIGLPTLSFCDEEGEIGEPFSGKVLIIGAGAGGLSAGYFLKQQGVDFEILEASQSFGGRMKINTEFADFPIPLGAEWLETDDSIFTEIVNDPNVDINIETISDEPDRKFVNYSWFNFFEEYIYPSVADKIRYFTPVKSVDYSANNVVVTTEAEQFVADKVIMSVPLKILQDNDIQFNPPLPLDKTTAISETQIWAGFKAFFEFSEKFFDDDLVMEIEPETDGQKVFYNASLGQSTNKHILGLFCVGKPALEYHSKSGDELRDFILQELDTLYNNKATPSYIKHHHQNWNDEPFIKSGYMSDYANWRTVKKLSESVENRLYFAGGEFTDGEDWVSVHTAALSAKKAVDELIKQ